MKINRKIIIYIEALLTVVIWGGTFVATKVTLQEASPALIVWLRFAIGIVVLGATVAIRKQFTIPAWRELPYLALLGLLGVTLHQWLQATGLQTAAATNTAWIVATIPMFTALLGWLVLKEKLGAIRVGGIILATIGVLVIVSKGDMPALFKGVFGTLGEFLILISSVNWAVFSILSRRGLKTYPATLMMFYVMVFGWLFANIWLFGFGSGLSEIPHLSGQGWIGILILGLLGSGVAYITWYDALQALPAGQLSVFINVEPLITTMIAALVLGESITWVIVLGAAMILLGIYLVNRPDPHAVDPA
jgi:drug/metabolite transporter (DMT)-like permease